MAFLLKNSRYSVWEVASFLAFTFRSVMAKAFSIAASGSSKPCFFSFSAKMATMLRVRSPSSSSVSKPELEKASRLARLRHWLEMRLRR